MNRVIGDVGRNDVGGDAGKVQRLFRLIHNSSNTREGQARSVSQLHCRVKPLVPGHSWQDYRLFMRS
jgi:hypothetical protein